MIPAMARLVLDNDLIHGQTDDASYACGLGLLNRGAVTELTVERAVAEAAVSGPPQLKVRVELTDAGLDSAMPLPARGRTARSASTPSPSPSPGWTGPARQARTSTAATRAQQRPAAPSGARRRRT